MTIFFFKVLLEKWTARREMYLMISNTILSLQFNGRFIPNFKRTDEFQSSRKSLLPTNSENREHLKIFRNVDCVLANHNKVQDICKQTSN